METKAPLNIKIRQFTNDDIDYIISRQIDLYRVEYGFTSEKWIAYITDGVHELIDRYDPEKDSIFILEANGSVSGCIAVTHKEDGVAHFRFFFVEPEFRGKGAGSKLIETAINFCREKKYKSIYLWTFSKLQAARHLYGKNGFRITFTQENTDWGVPIMEERWDLEL